MATITNKFFNRLFEGNDKSAVWENKLDGTWLDNLGWSFITQPTFNEGSQNDFMMRFDPMREKITFKHIGIPRNVGVTGDAGFWHAVSYEIEIKRPDGEDIHHEMGHFLLAVNDDERGDTPNNLRGDIIRQATIPRANGVLTTGSLFPESVGEAARQDPTFYSARAQSTSSARQNTIDKRFDPLNLQIQAKGGPNMDAPLTWLASQFSEGRPTGEQDWVFEFQNDQNPSQMINGQRVINPVGIGNLLSAFWIGKRKQGEEVLDILQYAQRVDLKFGSLDWPHIAVNTLIKQP